MGNNILVGVSGCSWSDKGEEAVGGGREEEQRESRRACTLGYLAASGVLISVLNPIENRSFTHDIQFWYS